MVLNFTPHPIEIYRRRDVFPDTGRGYLARYGARPAWQIPSSGIARAQSVETPDGDADGIPCVRVQFGRLEGLPEPRFGTYLVVSKITADAAMASGRTVSDLLLTTGLVRNEAGRIIGCTAFARP